MDGILEAFRLDGKVAMVTGSERGLGRGMAVALAQAGADIVGVTCAAGAPERKSGPSRTACEATNAAAVRPRSLRNGSSRSSSIHPLTWPAKARKANGIRRLP